MTDPTPPNLSKQGAAEASLLAAEALARLRRWLVLFDQRMEEAAERGDLMELRELVHFTTSLKRSLDVLQTTDHHAQESHGTTPLAGLDPEAIRQLFSEED